MISHCWIELILVFRYAVLIVILIYGDQLWLSSVGDFSSSGSQPEAETAYLSRREELIRLKYKSATILFDPICQKWVSRVEVSHISLLLTHATVDGFYLWPLA